MRVYVKEQPRSLALASDTHVLIFRSFEDQSGAGTKCIVKFAPKANVNFAGYVPLSTKDCYGFVGIINIGQHVYLGTISRSAQAASPRPNESIARIYGVEFYCLTSADWDFVALDTNGVPIDNSFSTEATDFIPGKGALLNIEHPCASIRKLLSNGSFYYSADVDLTAVMQNRGERSQQVSIGTIDESFMWNSYMMSELIQFRNRLPIQERTALDQGGFLTTVIRGFAGTSNVRIDGVPSQLTIISRQSCRRAGTRYNARGIDDEGNVANFVETETILWMGTGLCFGYCQLRGSVPVFWEQDSNILSGAKIQVTRSPEATRPAFNAHMQSLMARFGSVHLVNLLNDAKSGELELTRRFEQQVDLNSSLKTNLEYSHFDFHYEVALGGGYAAAAKIIPRIQDAMISFGFYSRNEATDQDETQQIGIIRVNCLDCLDRTNMVQQLVSKEALELFLEYHDLYGPDELWVRHGTLWADNGDQLSQIYAGTNALKSSFTRKGKGGIAGALADVTKSVGRLYINNFVDKGRQSTLDVLLGRAEGQMTVTLYDPINDYVNAELRRRRNEYSHDDVISIYAGTFNVNGVLQDVDLTPWLVPAGSSVAAKMPEMYLIGFQELVELTAGQILNADSERKEFWERLILDCLNKNFNNEEDPYILLRSGQLVGTALMIFVRRSQVHLLKHVEGATKKTGLGGMAGNKGGVAVSFDYGDTSFCFVTAHLAAGTNAVEERHQDYKTLSSGLRFSRGKRIKDHDTVIWLGDFNYRVDLPNEKVRAHLQADKDLGQLFEHDQLNLQMINGETFPFYNEMEIKFRPTYKFDNGTDTYDTSEKARTPSWTDRILSRGTNLRQQSYDSAPLLFSDHRPVYALFNADIVIVNESKKSDLARQLYDKRREEVGDTNYIVNISEITEATLTHGLPPPSSDSRKWWLAGGQSAKVNIEPPQPGMVLNPDIHNPFKDQNKPDWVKPPLPPRPESAQSFSLHSVPSNGSMRSNQTWLSTVSQTPSESAKIKPRPPVPRKPVALSPAASHKTASSAASLLDANEEDKGPQTSWPSLQPSK